MRGYGIHNRRVTVARFGSFCYQSHAILWFVGITGGNGGDRRVEHIIPPEARKKGKYDIVIESSCNGMFGVPWSGDTIDPPDVSWLIVRRYHLTRPLDEQVLRPRVGGSCCSQP